MLTGVRVATVALAFVVGCLLTSCGDDDTTTTKDDGRLPVPSVVGKTPDETRRELSAAGFRTRFQTLGTGRCAGLPPAGRIVGQDPPPGTPRQPKAEVKVQPSCGSNRSLRACSFEDFSVQVVAHDEFSAGSNGVGVELHHFRGSPCILHSEMTLEIRRPDGSELQPIAGNPSAASATDLLVGVGGVVSVVWRWYEWCDEPERAIVVAGFEGGEATQRLRTPAGCNIHKPSFLKKFYDVGVATDHPSYQAALRNTKPNWAGSLD